MRAMKPSGAFGLLCMCFNPFFAINQSHIGCIDLNFLHCVFLIVIILLISLAMMRSGAFGLPCVCYLQSFFCSAPKSRALECCHLKPSSSVLSAYNIFITFKHDNTFFSTQKLDIKNNSGNVPNLEKVKSKTEEEIVKQVAPGVQSFQVYDSKSPVVGMSVAFFTPTLPAW